MPIVNKYEHIPSFRLAYDCAVFKIQKNGNSKEVIRYNEKKFSLNAKGEIPRIPRKEGDDSGYRLVVEKSDEYFYYRDGKMVDWQKERCMKEYLGLKNQVQFIRLLKSKKKWAEEKINIFTEVEKINVNFYFDFVIDEFKEWFGKWRVDVPKINTESRKYELASKEEVNDNMEAIKWIGKYEQRKKLYEGLHKNNIISDCDEAIFFAHLKMRNEKQNTSITDVDKMQWNLKDTEFAWMISELVRLKLVPKHKKYKVFCRHFINSRGTEFINLAQTRNYASNCGNIDEKLLEIFRNI